MATGQPRAPVCGGGSPRPVSSARADPLTRPFRQPGPPTHAPPRLSASWFPAFSGTAHRDENGVWDRTCSPRRRRAMPESACSHGRWPHTFCSWRRQIHVCIAQVRRHLHLRNTDEPGDPRVAQMVGHGITDHLSDDTRDFFLPSGRHHDASFRTVQECLLTIPGSGLP